MTRWFLLAVLLAGVALIVRDVFDEIGRRAADSRSDPALRGVVLFLGDGMGIASITAARIERGTRAGLPHPSDGEFALDRAQKVSLVRTHSESHLVTDSAASITAILTGVRVPNNYICCIEGDDGEPDSLRTILEMAEAQGMATGVVTTSRLTHATPAGTYAHWPDRWAENEIATQLVPGTGNPRIGEGVEVLLGGGSRHFLPEQIGASGRRTDGRDLISEFEEAGYRIARDRSDLASAREAGSGRLLGLFASAHMTYSLDRPMESPAEPTLLEMVQTAVEILHREPNGFFLLVEGARIDHALHRSSGRRAVEEVLDFDDALGWVLEELGDEVLVAVTADHDHTMVVAGYARKELGVFSQAGVDRDGVPYTTLLFANGPGGEVPPVLDAETLSSDSFRERAGVPLGNDTHGAQDVPLYLWGPASLLDPVRATMDNTEIFHLLESGLSEVSAGSRAG